MSLFHDVRFPLDIALGARGGPERDTTILQLASGAEQRNSSKAHSRRRYDAGVGVKSLADIDRLVAFFEARRGELHSFRFRDPLDHKAVDSELGMGDGNQTRFTIGKAYTDGAGSYFRPVRLIDNLAVLPGQPYVVDGGDIVFEAPPDAGTPIVASFTFDTPVRFATSRLDISLDDVAAGEVASIPLIEVLASEVES